MSLDRGGTEEKPQLLWGQVPGRLGVQDGTSLKPIPSKASKIHVDQEMMLQLAEAGVWRGGCLSGSGGSWWELARAA